MASKSQPPRVHKSFQLKKTVFGLVLNVFVFTLQLIASASLYLAGKLKDDPIKIRDVINVTHDTMHRGAPPLELSDEYWAIRDGIVQAELLITRMLKFDLNIVHPHKVNKCTSFQWNSQK